MDNLKQWLKAELLIIVTWLGHSNTTLPKAMHQLNVLLLRVVIREWIVKFAAEQNKADKNH